MVLKGEIHIDVLRSRDEDDGYEPVAHGILVLPEDLRPDPSDPMVFRHRSDDVDLEVVVNVRADGTTTVTTVPAAHVVTNTLHAG